MVLEQRWTQVPAEQYTTETALVGDIPASPDTTVALTPAKGPAADEHGVARRRARAASRTSRCGQACRTSARSGHAVEVPFVPRVEPHLRPVAGTDVAVSCHLYHPPEATPTSDR